MDDFIDDLIRDGEPKSEGVKIGVDIGQRVDPTAIVVVEVERRGHQIHQWGTPRQHVVGGDRHYLARLVERLPLNTPYPVVADRVASIYRNLAASRTVKACYVDATGVGQPVVDLIRQKGVAADAVYITGGEKSTKKGKELRLAKSAMVSHLQVLLQKRMIHLPDTHEAQALIDELLNYEIKVTESANLKMGVFKTGAHDDLATALGLAVWEPPDRTLRIGPAPDMLSGYRG